MTWTEEADEPAWARARDLNSNPIRHARRRAYAPWRDSDGSMPRMALSACNRVLLYFQCEWRERRRERYPPPWLIAGVARYERGRFASLSAVAGGGRACAPAAIEPDGQILLLSEHHGGGGGVRLRVAVQAWFRCAGVHGQTLVSGGSRLRGAAIGLCKSMLSGLLRLPYSRSLLHAALGGPVVCRRPGAGAWGGLSMLHPSPESRAHPASLWRRHPPPSSQGRRIQIGIG